MARPRAGDWKGATRELRLHLQPEVANALQERYPHIPASLAAHNIVANALKRYIKPIEAPAPEETR